MFLSWCKNPSTYPWKSMLVLISITVIYITIQSNIHTQKAVNRIFKTAWLQITIDQNDSKTNSKLRNSIYNLNSAESKTILMVNSNQSFGDYIFSRIGSFFFGESDSLETTVRCVGSLRNQSCLYRNLYYVNSTFMVLTIKGRILPILTVRTDSFTTETISPTQREFASYVELERFIRESVYPIVLPGTTVFFKFPWLGNIGHTLFDALYPAYVALIRFPPRHLRPFRLLSAINECPTCRDEDILNRFAGLGIMKYYVLKDMSNGTWFVFDELVMGSGMLCQRCTQPNLQLPGGVELNGSRLFRDRMYAQHGVIPPARRYKHSAEGRNRHDVLRGYIIENKRYTRSDWEEIKAAIEEINNYTIKHQNESIININKLDWPLINVSVLWYGDIKPRKRTPSRFNATPVDARSPTYELKETYFSYQLQRMPTMDIHISGPGTGQMYQTFLADGSVVINVGGLQVLTPEDRNITYTAYLEQYMTAGAPYLKGLYYPINERPKGIKRQVLVKLIRQAAKLIMDGFTIPVNPIESLAPDGRLFIEMCEKDKRFCELVTARAPGVDFACYHFWVDDFIHERGLWKGLEGSDGYTNARCPFNRTLLHELRNKYGIRHYNTGGN